jgi:glycosyltransferase involved in cell wall biosynthesis
MKVLITAPALDENDNVSGISSIVRSIVSSDSDIAYSHFEAGRKDQEGIGPAWLARQLALPFRFLAAIRRESPDVIHINTAFAPAAIVRDLVLARVARLASRPVLLHVHGGEFLRSGFSGPLLSALASRLAASASIILVLTEEEKAILAERYPSSEIAVLPNGVDISAVPKHERPEIGERTIIFLGRLHGSKGLADIVEVSRTLAAQGFTFRFHCYGAGPDREGFVTEMTKILGERFVFGGVVGSEAKWEAFANADIFLLPSMYEGLPVAMLEAMAAGCVPVASDRGGIGSVIKDGYNGFLIEPGNLTQICGKLKILLTGDPGWAALRANARQTIAERYAFETYMKKLEAVYHGLIPNHAR